MIALAVAAAWLTLAQGTTLQPHPRSAAVATTAAAPGFPAFLRSQLRGVRFARRSVLAAVAPVPTPCHRIEVTGTSRTGQTLVVYAEVREPAPGTICTQVIATAYHVVSVPRLAAPQRVVLRLQR